MTDILRSQEKLSIIDQIPLFTGLSPNEKRFIAASMTIIEYKKGDIVYGQGAAPDGFYCVITGRLRAYISRRDREENLEYLKRGKYFGIISLLTGEPHSVTVQAINDSVILKIPKDDFGAMLKRVPGLAIHFSQTLSRRLRRKDIEGKKIFESTILSVCGFLDGTDLADYAANLAVSLKRETDKRVVILNMENMDILKAFGIAGDPRPLSLESPLFDQKVVEYRTFKTNLGVDVLNVSHKAGEYAHLIALLSYLTSDYHFILVLLPDYMDNAVLGSLKQSDSLHIMTGPDEAALHQAARLIEDLKNSSTDIEDKIKVILYKKDAAIQQGAAKEEYMKHGIFATLAAQDASGEPDYLRVVRQPDCEYSKTIRRIARQMGDCLIGLALGSGAAMGLAHVGVLRVIERHEIPIDILAGTSIGAFIGALWALGRDTYEIEEALCQLKSRIATLRLADLAIPRMGLLKGREIKRFLVSKLGTRTFYDLKLPLKIVTCDIARREEVVLEEGSLAEAVMASVAIPGVFEPVRIGERLLVDGGIINPLPTNVLTRFGVSKIIAVNTLPSPEDVQRARNKVTNIFDIIVNSVQASEYLLAEMSCQAADIALHPVLPTVDWYEFYEQAEVIRRGEEEALKHLPQMKELAASK